MEGKAFAALVEVLGLDDAGHVDHALIGSALGLDLQFQSSLGRLAVVLIGCDGCDDVAALCRRPIGDLVGSSGYGAIDDVVNVESHVAHGALSRRHVGTERGAGVHFGWIGIGAECNLHGVVDIEMAQDDAVEVEEQVATLDNEAQALLTFLQLHLQPTVMNLIGTPVAGLSHRHLAGKVGQALIGAQCQREGTTAILRREVGVELVESGLLHVDGVLEPFACMCPTDGIAARDTLDVDATGITAVACSGTTLILRVTVVIGDALGSGVEVLALDGSWNLDDTLEGCARLIDGEARPALVLRSVGGIDDSLHVPVSHRCSHVLGGVGSLGESGVELVVDVEVNMVDGLRAQTGTHLDRHDIVLRYGERSRLDIDRCFLDHAWEGTFGVLGSIGSHILAQPGHGRTILAVADEARVAVGSPRLAIDVAPEGDASAVVGFPHHGNLFLVALLLQGVVGGADVVLRTVHGHFQLPLQLVHGILEGSYVAIGEVV